MAQITTYHSKLKTSTQLSLLQRLHIATPACMSINPNKIKDWSMKVQTVLQIVRAVKLSLEDRKIISKRSTIPKIKPADKKRWVIVSITHPSIN